MNTNLVRAPLEEHPPIALSEHPLGEAKEALRFMLRQRVKGFQVPDAPLFDSAATTEWFTDRLRQSSLYLEYGSGGSTCYAARLGKRFFTTDSDAYYLKHVKRKIVANGHYNQGLQTYHHANIGITGPWGFPVVYRQVSRRRSHAFARYSDFPTEALYGDLPDLVLVDGRFRVACALKAALSLKDHSGWTLVVDDYEGRLQYQILEQILHLETMVGRMAVFTGVKPFQNEQLRQAIADYEQDFR